MSKQLTRREFTGSLAAAGVAAAAGRSVLAGFPAHEKVRLGFIGVGNRGDQLLNAFLAHEDAQVTAICDVYEPYLAPAARKAGGSPFVTGDYRKLLERKDVDAVVIATPDHWHGLQFIEACAAGKDVYVEKPLSLRIAEGRKMAAAAERYDRITQVGLQRRSSQACQKAVELVGSGAIGKVTACRCNCIRNEWPMGIGDPPDSDPPPGLDWNTWLGPAPKVPFNENRCLYKFRWFWDYSGGQMTNFGTHFLDVIQWALGENAPRGVFATGGRLAVEDNREVPDTMEATWDYPGGTIVTFSQFSANGADGHARPSQIEIRGTKGTLYFNWNSVEILPTAVRIEPLSARNPLHIKENSRQDRATKAVIEKQTVKGGDPAPDHARNFLDGVKTRTPCRCPVEIGHRSTTATLLANIAFHRKRYLEWDAERERVKNDPEANEMLSYAYREPWKLPEEG